MHSRRYRTLRILGWPALAVVVAPALAAAGAQSPRTGRRAEVVQPALDLSWTSGAPDPRGDGASMSGTGLDVAIRAGVLGAIGGLRLRLVPELILDANTDHPTFASGDPARDPFASPFYHGDFSADLPSRPGDGSLARVAFGESAIWWSGAHAFVGAMTTTPRWGPRRVDREATAGDLPGEGLVLGRSAPGVPRVEVAFAWRPRPFTSIARVRWFGGAVRESAWFDADDANDTRALAGVRVELERPGAFSAGASRTVMSAGGADLGDGLLRPFAKARPASTMEIVAADLVYAHERAGTTLWIELARQEPIGSAGAFLRAPFEGIAVRSGFSQRVARGAVADWVATMEFVRLDQAATRDDVAPRDLYTSAAVIHGWTHEGQPLGSGLGPGGQRQVASLRRLGRTWRLGGFVERARRNEDALLRDPAAASDRHDVTLRAGFSVARRVAAHDVTASLALGRRFNYLFQGASTSPGNQAVDLSVLQVGVTFTPTSHAPRIVGVFPEP